MGDVARLDRGPELGARVAAARRRRGLSRQAAAELCGRSEEWLRKIERGQRGTSLRMVARLADVLKVADLSELLGDIVPTTLYARPEHGALAQVRAALAAVPSGGTDDPARKVTALRADVASAWRLRSVSGRDRSDLAAVLPRLLLAAPAAVRGGDDPREAHRLAAEVYHLGQLYLCYQDAPELLWVVVDRGMREALDADDPLAAARAAWFSAYLYRDTGHVDQAHQAVDDALRELDTLPEPLKGSPAERRHRSFLALAAALNHARDGAHANAWRWWDIAETAAREADAGGVPLSPHALFGQDPADVALALDVELGRSTSALSRAESTDTDAVTSVPRRTRLLLEVARAHLLRREHTATVALLRSAYETGPEATVYSLHGRAMVYELGRTVGPMLRPQVTHLADAMGVSA
ncbi:MAG: helix-turn-helix domain-containing protein [Actinomycetales bacterium]